MEGKNKPEYSFCSILRLFKNYVLVLFHFNWIKSHDFCDPQILHKFSTTCSLPPNPSPSQPGNLPFKFDMAWILIAPQRHSDNFTTKQGDWGAGWVLFSALIKRATVLSFSLGANSWHQTGETSNLVLQHPSDAMSLGPSKVNCSCLDKTLKSCLGDSQLLFYNLSSWQKNQEALLSQGLRQVIVFPN